MELFQSLLEGLVPGRVLGSIVDEASYAIDSIFVDVVFDAFCVQFRHFILNAQDAKEFKDCQMLLLY